MAGPRAGRSGVRFAVEARDYFFFFRTSETASYSAGTGVSFPGGKAAVS